MEIFFCNLSFQDSCRCRISITSTLRSVAEVAVPRTASGPAGSGLAVTSPAGAASGGPPGRCPGRGSAGAGRVTRRGTGRSPATPSPAPPRSASGHSGSSGRTGQTRSWWRPGWSGQDVCLLLPRKNLSFSKLGHFSTLFQLHSNSSCP